MRQNSTSLPSYVRDREPSAMKGEGAERGKAYRVNEGVVDDCEEEIKSIKVNWNWEGRQRTKKIGLTTETSDGTFNGLLQILKLDPLLGRVSVLGRDCTRCLSIPESDENRGKRWTAYASKLPRLHWHPHPPSSPPQLPVRLRARCGNLERYQ
jgi:hypothetical protein